MEITKFKYLIHKKDRLKKETLLSNYTPKQLGTLLVIWNSENTHYYVFDNINTLEEYILNKPPSDRTYHEVIFGKRPQKLKFDIDRCPPESLDNIMNAIKYVWKNTSLLIPYNKRQNVKIFTFDTSGFTNVLSRHIIIDYYVPNVDVAKMIYNEVKSYLKAKNSGDEQFLDNIYGSIQNFRLMYCSKNKDGFPKTSLSKSVKFKDSIISYIV